MRHAFPGVILLLIVAACSNAANDRTPGSSGTAVGDAGERHTEQISRPVNRRVLPDCLNAVTAETWASLGVTEEQRENLRHLQAKVPSVAGDGGQSAKTRNAPGSGSPAPGSEDRRSEERPLDAHRGQGGSTHGEPYDEVFQAELGAILHTDQLRSLAKWCESGVIADHPR